MEYVDYYELLEIDASATDAEIKRAYRKKSLQVHPDKRLNDPEATRLFHELTLAQAALLDSATRLAFDTVRRAKLERKEQHAKYSAEQKRMLNDLEERELKRQKTAENEATLAQKIAEIRAATDKLRDFYNRPTNKEQNVNLSNVDESLRTVRVKCYQGSHMEVKKWLCTFGKIENMVTSSRTPDKKYQLILVVFECEAHAIDAIASKHPVFVRNMTWANRPTKKLNSSALKSAQSDYEKTTLLRMKMKDRERMDDKTTASNITDTKTSLTN